MFSAPTLRVLCELMKEALCTENPKGRPPFPNPVKPDAKEDLFFSAMGVA